MPTLSFELDVKMNSLFAVYLSEVKQLKQGNDSISASIFQHIAAHSPNVKANTIQTKHIIYGTRHAKTTGASLRSTCFKNKQS